MNQQKPSKVKSVVTFLRRQEKTTLLIIVVATITLAVSGAVSIILERNTIVSLPSMANIRAVGVEIYGDPNLQNRKTQIDWGIVYPGSSFNITLYLQSTSNVPTTLVLVVANWTFMSQNGTIVAGPVETTPYMNLTWNYNNQTLSPGQVLQTTLTLTTDGSSDFVAFLLDNSVERFTMDTTIQAREK